MQHPSIGSLGVVVITSDDKFDIVILVVLLSGAAIVGTSGEIGNRPPWGVLC